jgi:8-oxo-dGTP diphosphatase
MKCITEFLQTFGESTKRRVSSKGVIISPSNKILILRIQTGCHAEGIWDLPGGGVEDNESLIDCLKREVKEETNLDLDTSTIKNITVKNFDIAEDGVHAKWNYFRAKCTNTNVVLNPAKWLHNCPEHSEYMWLDSISELDKLDMCEQHKNILRQELKKLINK